MSDEKLTYDPKEYGYVKDGKVFRKAYGKNPELEIGIVRESEEQSMAYFVDRFQNLNLKVIELEKAVTDATNKGSFLMKLLHMKEKMPEYKGIGNFQQLIDRLNKLEDQLQGNIAQNRVKNLEIKKVLLKEALELKESTDWEETAEKMKELRLNWVRTGAVVEDQQEELEKTFHDSVNYFFEGKRKFKEERKKQIADRSRRYKYLISDVKKLQYERDKEAIVEKLKKIKSEWERVGEIPEKLMKPLEIKLSRNIQNLKNPLKRRRIGQVDNNRPSFQNRSFGNQNRPTYGNQSRPYDNQNQSRFQRDQPREESSKEQLEEKTELLNMALELKNMPLNKSVLLAKELQDKWLRSGKSSAPDIRIIYNKFREAIALIFERNNLESEIKKKYPVFASKSQTEQKIIKIGTLREMIRKDKREIKLFEDNLQQSGKIENQDPQSQMLVSKLRGQKFRVRIKESLLNDIEMG